jgi:hypothetical protein
MRNLEKCPECLQRFHVEWQGKSSQKGISFFRFLSLKTFLKREYSTYTPIKSNVLEREHFNKFLEDAPDKIYLLIKVSVFIMVVSLNIK